MLHRSLDLISLKPSDESAANQARESLAAYRSTVLQPGNLVKIIAPGSTEFITAEDLVNLPKDRDSVIHGFKVMRSSGRLQMPRGLNVLGDGAHIWFNMDEAELLIPFDSGRQDLQRIVKNMIIVTPTQTLDNIVWENVVFVNAHISYKGGPLTLRNVHFVNCTFDVPAQTGRPVLNYAINVDSQLIIEGDHG